MLDWTAHGVKLEFVNPFAPGQDKHPCFKQKLQVVQSLLHNTVGPEATPNMLNRDKPAPVRFANRVSCSIYNKFVRENIQELVSVGALAAREAPEFPVVINGLAVVKNRQGKLRLILDCRYVNMFIMYDHFAYEKLHDVMMSSCAYA